MERLKKQYGLKDPQAIKMRILWMTLKQIVCATFGDSPKNRKIIAHYDDQWKRVEAHENAA